MNISAISHETWLGKLLRLPLRLLPAKTVVPILQGRLKGMKWITGAGIHRYWLGSYEYHTRLRFEKIIREGTIIFDIGAHVGFYTLLSSLLVGPGGRVYAFEPLARNLFYLKEHLRLNHISNVTVIEAAVADSCGYMMFQEGENSSMGLLAPQGNLRVKTLSLDDLIARQELPVPNYLKIDVEGAELLVLQGAKATIDNYHPTIILATHGKEISKRCFKFLKEFNYKLEPMDNRPLAEPSEILAYYET